MVCDSPHVLLETQSRFIASAYSLIARKWNEPTPPPLKVASTAVRSKSVF